MDSELGFVVFTIGHSTRTVEEFVSILHVYGVGLVVDVRAAPHSRHTPQFSKENLQELLKAEGIRYSHVPELGGFRRSHSDSVNLALPKGLRGYADYMQTREFTENLAHLISLAHTAQTAVMCAEALPWRCHRSLLSDALNVRGVTVEHILTADSHLRHKLTETAHVDGTKITYPLYSEEDNQRTLLDY
ncbi:MAG: DUF488 domain-containing protein [Candidatus Bathyarchaeota archaeon]|nr:DUF488 domain-containing protein [Candidatus Bathyarchaeota archaeon]